MRTKQTARPRGSLTVPSESGQPEPHAPLVTHSPRAITVLLIAVLIVIDVSLFTNRMPPKWDMAYYVDMAAHGILGNVHMAAPFAYRPAAPLIVGTIASIFHAGPETVFRISTHVMCVAFILSCFYFGRALGATSRAAMLAAVLIALYFYIIKWNAFSGAMVDIYAYPLVLLAFWALLKNRFYLCLVACAAGLFFKEFLLVPLLTQGVVVLMRSSSHRTQALLRTALIILVVLLCFVIPRRLIHVTASFQDIDPIHNPASISRLVSYPMSWRRDLNILFAYVSCWLPICLLLTSDRVKALWSRLRPYRLPVLAYLAFHFLLVMYGGTNLCIFVTYSLPIQMLVFVILLDEGGIQPWEVVLALVAVLLFNRLWMPIPSPDTAVQDYLEFYGGYHMLLTARSITRIAELLGWGVAAWLMRAMIGMPAHPAVPPQLTPEV